MNPIYIIDGLRTPFLKAKGAPGQFSPADLAVQAGRALLLRQPFLPSDLDEVILGCAAPSPDEVNTGRVLALRLGCGVRVPGWTVMRNCASGMQALDSAMANIHCGRSQLVLAGGVDALSRTPLLFSDQMVQWLAAWYGAKSAGARATVLTRFRLTNLAPVIGLLKGLTDPVVGLSMGQTAENLVRRFGLTRRQLDEYSVESHLLAAAAKANVAREITPLVDRSGRSTPMTTAFVRIPAPTNWPRCGRSSTSATATSPPATAPRSPTARPCCCWLPRRPSTSGT